MATLIERGTRLEAWLEAARQLIEAEDPQFNVILSIDTPGTDGAQARIAYDAIDAFLAAEDKLSNHDVYPLHTVAETIFPGWEYAKRGIDGVFKKYADEEYDSIRMGWGTYAHRMLRRKDASGNIVNPLERLISKMKSELGMSSGTKKACYELGVAEGEYDLPLYNATGDQGRRRGGPCLSHLSFKLWKSQVHLTAVYRSHDYRHKAFGNMLGLARLQACVAQEVGGKLGTLVIHSTFAYVDGAKGRLKDLLDEIDRIVGKGATNELAGKVR